ncbi:MAG: alpha/beta fold hydrolase [Burkholderiales bacterium]
MTARQKNRGRWRIWLAVAWLALAGGCARLPSGVTPLTPATLSELRDYLLNRTANVDQFRLRGPFAVTVRPDFELRLSDRERIDADLYLSAPAEKAPLVILLHGHDNTKKDHAYQAYHLATWGIHSLAVTLPNKGPWVGNGRALARIATHIRRRPDAIDSRIDVNRIILAGHSFGGAAVAIALADGAPAAGGILLDAAGTGKGLPGFLRKVAKPVMLLGADERISPVRDRSSFFFYIRSNVAEVSIADATHDDAQFPLQTQPRRPGSELSSATEELQLTFVSALTAAAFSLGYAGSFDYAWRSFRDPIADGRFFRPKKK